MSNLLDQTGSVCISDSGNQAEEFLHPAAAGDLLEDNLTFVHKEKDFISLLSCTPGQFSYCTSETPI